MYLSRVEIDKDNRRKLKDLTHLGAYHNWVEESFPDEFNGEIRSRKLWRLDSIGDKNYLLVVSRNKPDLSCLEKYGVSNSAKTKDYSQFIDSLTAGMDMRFRVTLNPVMSLSNGKDKRGRVVPHVTEEYQLKFFEERASKWGFQIKKVTITDRSFPSLKGKGNKNLKISRVTYEGVLTVTDLKNFLSTLTNGVGKKKAYGMGLLTVIPLRNEHGL